MMGTIKNKNKNEQHIKLGDAWKLHSKLSFPSEEKLFETS